MQADSQIVNSILKQIKEVDDKVDNQDVRISVMEANSNSTVKRINGLIAVIASVALLFAPWMWAMHADLAKTTDRVENGVAPAQWFLDDMREIKTRLRTIEKNQE